MRMISVTFASGLALHQRQQRLVMPGGGRTRRSDGRWRKRLLSRVTLCR